MLTPLKWKNEVQVGPLVATLAGAIFGVIAGGSLEHGWFNMLIWGSLTQSLSAGGFISIRLFVSAHAHPLSLPATMDD
jgi:hypothetical protein